MSFQTLTQIKTSGATPPPSSSGLKFQTLSQISKPATSSATPTLTQVKATATPAAASTTTNSTATKIFNAYPQTMKGIAELQVDPLSLKANPKKAIGDAWNALKSSVAEEKIRINDYLSEYKQKPTDLSPVGKTLKVATGAANIIFSPLSALFAGANDIPVLGSVSKLITLPFSAVGETGTNISNGLVDKLPISQKAKDNIKPGLGEIFALAGQIALGKALEIGDKKFAELKGKYGVEDATTIVNKANELAKEAPKAEVPKGEVPKTEGTPTQLTAPADLLISHEGAPDIKTVEQYKADIQAGKPIEPIKVIKEGTKYGIEDGKHRFQAYQELGIKDIPIELVEGKAPVGTVTEKPVITPKEVAVPREQLPVGGGEERVSSLEARVKGVLDKTSPDIVEKMGLSTYESMNKADQIKMASDFVVKNQDEALKVLTGEKEAPPGILKNSIYVAMDNLASKDIELATKLATLEATRSGQELSILTEINPDSPVKLMRDVIEVREKAFEEKTGKTPAKARGDAVKSVTEAVRKARPNADEWKQFIKEIECGGL